MRRLVCCALLMSASCLVRATASSAGLPVSVGDLRCEYAANPLGVEVGHRRLSWVLTMYRRMSEDMDIDCGTIVTGAETIETLGKRIFALLIATASGQTTRSEQLGYGDNEFVPWQAGAIM